jgi:transcriptional regulator with GAF, ATPase, and Fis domain
MSRLSACSWPGNIRELQNVIERASSLISFHLRRWRYGSPESEIPPSEAANLPAFANRPIEVSYDGEPAENDG